MKAKVIIMAAVLALAVVYNANAAGEKKFNGNGPKNTEVFTMDKPWVIEWDARSNELFSLFQVYLYRENGTYVDLLANESPGSVGKNNIHKTGKFYMQVNAIGQWKITIRAAE